MLTLDYYTELRETIKAGDAAKAVLEHHVRDTWDKIIKFNEEYKKKYLEYAHRIVPFEEFQSMAIHDFKFVDNYTNIQLSFSVSYDSFDYEQFPACWLYADDDTIKSGMEKRWKEYIDRYLLDKKENEKRKELFEREEYERLKAKFEKGENK